MVSGGRGGGRRPTERHRRVQVELALPFGHVDGFEEPARTLTALAWLPEDDYLCRGLRVLIGEHYWTVIQVHRPVPVDAFAPRSILRLQPATAA